MKGFKDSDGKFRPISSSKGIRKKLDKTRETTGIQISTGIIKREPYKIIKSNFVKGRWDIINHDNIVIDFRFTKKGAQNYAKRWNIELEDDRR